METWFYTLIRYDSVFPLFTALHAEKFLLVCLRCDSNKRLRVRHLFATSDARDRQYPLDVLGAFNTELLSAAIATITAESVACKALIYSEVRPRVSDNSSRSVMKGFLLGGSVG
jgi:hypothetical protein